MRVSEAATWLAAPLLLVAVAAAQWVRVAEHDQSSWSGIGFGMFATFEEETNRRVLVTLEIDGRSIPAAVPAELADDADRLRTVPSARATQALAEALLDVTWRIEDRRAVPDAAGAAATRAVVVVQGLAVDGGDDPLLRPLVVRRAEAAADG